jgi:hypothetical protein
MEDRVEGGVLVTMLWALVMVISFTGLFIHACWAEMSLMAASGLPIKILRLYLRPQK